MNQSQTYQGNPYGVYLDLSSFTGSGVIQNSVTCIKQSAPNKDHIIWYQSFDSCYRFYPIHFFLLCNLCLSFLFASYFVLVTFLFVFLFVFLFLFLFVFLFSFLFLFLFLFLSDFVSTKKIILLQCLLQILLPTKSITNSVWRQFGLPEEFRGFRV